MELRHLRYFIAVADALNFRCASEQLRVAQPALSKQIKNLEEDIGVTLFHRNTGGVRLTDAGAVFLDEARDILERVEMAILAARDAQLGLRGRLAIGNLGALSSSFLASTLSIFHSQYPLIEVNLIELNLREQLAALKSGLIQIGFTLKDNPEIDAGFESLPIFEGPLTVAMGRSHPLSQKSRISLHEIAHESLFYLGQSEHEDIHRKRIHAIFASRGIKHNPIKRISSFASITTLIAADHGLSILLENSHSSDDIVFCPIQETGEDLLINLSAIWLKERHSQLAKSFVDVLLQNQLQKNTHFKIS